MFQYQAPTRIFLTQKRQCIYCVYYPLSNFEISSIYLSVIKNLIVSINCRYFSKMSQLIPVTWRLSCHMTQKKNYQTFSITGLAAASHHKKAATFKSQKPQPEKIKLDKQQAASSSSLHLHPSPAQLISTSTHLHLPPASSFQSPPSSLQHLQLY